MQNIVSMGITYVTAYSAKRRRDPEEITSVYHVNKVNMNIKWLPASITTFPRLRQSCMELELRLWAICESMKKQ